MKMRWIGWTVAVAAACLMAAGPAATAWATSQGADAGTTTQTHPKKGHHAKKHTSHSKKKGSSSGSAQSGSGSGSGSSEGNSGTTSKN
jgi:hypothetical protein